MTAPTNKDAIIAFLITALAGAATALGASVVFFPSLVKLTSRRVLAGALGFSAGVMTYVSFVEIFQKSVSAFQDAEFEENMAYIYATLSFFGGVLMMKLVDVCVQLLNGGNHHHHTQCCDIESSPHYIGQTGTVGPVAELNEWHESAERELEEENNQRTVDSNDGSNEEVEEQLKNDSEEFCENLESQQSQQTPGATGENDRGEVQQRIVENPPAMKDPHEEHRLVKMGISTALAIAIHNFPEGLATFVATLHDPSVGLVLAIAIGIHNIPEGLCVALPIYYATGNRCKAFGWACLSGASEPIAAMLGWVILAQTMSQIVYAILFGLVAGMMVIISMKELLPTAHRYDVEDTVVTYSFIAGMALISLSLVLFVV